MFYQCTKLSHNRTPIHNSKKTPAFECEQQTQPHLIRNKICRVKADTELSNHRDVGAGLKSLHERLRSGLCDRTQVVDHIGFRHADTGVNNCDRAIGLYAQIAKIIQIAII